MKITFIGHASILIESKGITVLSDPWWRGPCFGAQWWTYPLPFVEAVEARRIDYIYISHGHHDHLHPGTLKTLSRDATVLVSSRIGIAESIKGLGFKVIEIDDDQSVALGNGELSCRIIETHAADTLMTLSDGDQVCVNLNDALHAAPADVQTKFVARLKAMHPKIDYVFCGYGVASHFPNCYVIPGKDREASAARRQRYFNRQWAGLIEALHPVYGFPFAADVAFFEDDLFWVNEVTHNAERPTATFKAMFAHSTVVTKDIAPGFVVENGRITSEVLRQPVSSAQMRKTCADQIDRANRYGGVDDALRDEVIDLLKENLECCAGYLRSYADDYRFLIRFRGSPFAIRIGKKGQDLRLESVQDESDQGYDLSYTTRLAYVKWSLTRPFGDEILFVGSGGVFQYFDADKARINLHRELMYLLRKHEAVAPRRPAPQPRLIHIAKQLGKKLLGRATLDLYDLGKWTVFDKH